MSTAKLTFSTNTNMPENQRELTTATAYTSSAGEVEQDVQFHGNWDNAKQARGVIESAVQNALAGGQGYPLEQGTFLVQSMAWLDGLAALLDAQPGALRVADLTNHLLPELAPVTRDDHPDTWLDTQFPIYRTLQVDIPQVRRITERSLAILFQDGHLFADPENDIEIRFSDLADEIRRDLTEQFDIRTYSGSEVAPRSVHRGAMLQEIFTRNQAVLFLGHLHRSPDGRSGWRLTNEDEGWLPISQIVELLGGGRKPGRQQGARAGIQGVPVPDVVFTICCSGAWGEPVLPGQMPIFYPEKFLNAGVRFFIGSWMDVILRGAQDYDVLHKLVSGFFSRWSNDPDRAPVHLYAAKKECGFPLLTSLYQLYVLGEPAAAAARQEPDGALVSGLATGDRLGDYLLDEEVWADPYARTFWAHGKEHGKPALVQVLVDEWQDNHDVVASLEAALQKLAGAGLSQGHLVPDRLEYLMWSRGDSELRELHALIYDRPEGELLDQWSCLASERLDVAKGTHFQTVLKLGVQVSALLAELHGKDLLHGNLDPGSIVLREIDAVKQVLVKDAWVKQIRPGRTTRARYAAPEEPAEGEGPDRLKYDCWGLGVILFELATGQPFAGESDMPPGGLPNSIRAAFPGQEREVPEALERVVRECLMPAAALRPDSGEVAGRLWLAAESGGAYVSEIEDLILQRIRAGNRLVYVQAEDMQDLEAVLTGMTKHAHGDKTVRLLVAAEEVGLTDTSTGANLVQWSSAEDVQDIYDLPGPAPIELVAGENGRQILEYVAGMPPPPRDERRIVLLRGAEWWDSMPLFSTRLSRILKESQEDSRFPEEGGSLTIVIGDSFTHLNPEVAPRFTWGDFPSPSPSELFERILAAPRADHLDVPDITADEAIDLAQALGPCSRREITQALRLCAAKYGRIDERLLLIRDEERARFFRQFDTVTYLPISRLPEVDTVGLPPDLYAKVEVWAQAMRAEGPCPRRLMITSPSGCGKSTLAQAMARRIQLPLIRLEASRCLRGRLGESEAALRHTLLAASSLAGAVVLLDDVDQFLGGPAQQGNASPVAATMARMSSQLLTWLDAMPYRFVTVMTSKDPELKDAQWQRRVEMTLALAKPILRHEEDLFQPSLAYRSAVFAALFHRFGLPGLAADDALMREVARDTDPSMRQTPLPSPAARRSPDGPLANHTVSLETGAEIEHWISETLYLHWDRSPPPEDAEFWRSAIR